jgi:hypothetical protein
MSKLSMDHRKWRLSTLVAMTCLGVLSTYGCAESLPEAHRISLAEEDFADHFVLLDSVVLEQSDSLPIVQVSGVDIRADGSLLLSDASESVVKLFDASGRLLSVIGRSGSGPGEFRVPFAPRFGADGRIHVPDFALWRVSIFDPSGRFEKQIRLEGFRRISSFEVLSDSTYVVGGLKAEGDENVAFRIGVDGRILAEYLPVADLLPSGAARSPLWETVRKPSIAVSDGVLYGVQSVVPILWEVALGSGKTASTRLDLPDYIAPSLPPDVPTTRLAMREWAESFELATSVAAGDSFVLIPFTRGTLYEGDPTTYALRGAGQKWVALSDGPPVVRGVRNIVVAILSPLQDRTILGVYGFNPH